MTESTGNSVALFIDWDNLAISIAADMGGATPDVKRIVQKAQEYGNIILARAYAEWNTMSERLSVYRAGVEPVYAPTFRFETDPVTQASRGKSLADPVMVADCIDTLHILPQINVYVIVSGDKDLIPVVRLAQLRGRRVVVIGPDFVAGVLRDMADEFVPYRGLVQGTLAEVGAPHLVPRPREAVSQPSRRQPARAVGGVKAPPAKPAAVTPVRAVAPQAEEREPEAAPELPDLPTVFAALVEILTQMAATGRVRVRATNLKDQLLLRLPGFSERKYGFAKFKDLLLAAERGGLISVSAAGPVHWVSLPTAEPVAPPEVEVPIVEPEVAPVVVAEAPAEVAEAAEQARDRRLAVVRFIDELRQRSRWLTYTYVLTNVIGFIGRLMPPGEAEAEARSILNYLVAEGALRIDKVPQEVDVGGIKHRVRMCHFVDDHPLVHEARATVGEEPSAEAAAAEAAAAAEPAATGVAELEAEERRQTPAGEPSLELGEVAAEVAEPSGDGRLAEAVAAETLAEEPRAPSRSRRGRRRSRSTANRQALAEAAEAGEAYEAGQPEAPAEAEAAAREEPVAPVAPSEELVPAPRGAPPAEEMPAAPPQARPTLDEVFAQVREILTDLASHGKARVTGSSLKLRLSRLYGGFEERQFGFAKFKDFLDAAERAGAATVEVDGQVAWVRAPRGAEVAAEQPAAPAEAAPEQPATPAEVAAEQPAALPEAAVAAEGEAPAEPVAEAVPAEKRPASRRSRSRGARGAAGRRASTAAEAERAAENQVPAEPEAPVAQAQAEPEAPVAQAEAQPEAPATGQAPAEPEPPVAGEAQPTGPAEAQVIPEPQEAAESQAAVEAVGGAQAEPPQEEAPREGQEPEAEASAAGVGERPAAGNENGG